MVMKMSAKIPAPQKMWATYNFGVLWGIGYTRKQSREAALAAGGYAKSDWPKMRGHFQSHKVTVGVRDA
jgi:hypothetical protein